MVVSEVLHVLRQVAKQEDVLLSDLTRDFDLAARVSKTLFLQVISCVNSHWRRQVCR